jgi:hypothetical protein
MKKFDWSRCISRYNVMMQTKYMTSRDLLKNLYKETKSVTKMEIILDCHNAVIRKEMDRLKIPRKKTPKENHKEKKLLSISKKELKGLYPEEIAELCDCSVVYVNKMCREHDLQIKRYPVGQRRKPQDDGVRVIKSYIE